MPNPIAVATTLACLLAAPDVIPRGLRGVKVEQRVGFGVLADRVVVRREIAKGDTIESFAVKEYGDRARTADILALNPLIEPHRLVVGQQIWLPAKKPGDDGALYVYVVPVALGMRSSEGPAKPYVTDKLPLSRTDGYRFLLVPAQHREAFEQSLDGEAKTKLADEVAKQIVEVRGDFHGRYVHEDSPVQRVVSTIEFTRDDEGKLKLATKNVCYDKDGKETVETAPLPGRGNGKERPSPRKEEALLLLGLLGGGWLVLRGRRPALAPQAG
ncbi:MAG: LysM domain-containing protein [Planctomycetota bacterium]